MKWMKMKVIRNANKNIHIFKFIMAKARNDTSKHRTNKKNSYALKDFQTTASVFSIFAVCEICLAACCLYVLGNVEPSCTMLGDLKDLIALNFLVLQF